MKDYTNFLIQSNEKPFVLFYEDKNFELIVHSILNGRLLNESLPNNLENKAKLNRIMLEQIENIDIDKLKKYISHNRNQSYLYIALTCLLGIVGTGSLSFNNNLFVAIISLLGAKFSWDKFYFYMENSTNLRLDYKKQILFKENIDTFTSDGVSINSLDKLTYDELQDKLKELLNLREMKQEDEYTLERTIK